MGARLRGAVTYAESKVDILAQAANIGRRTTETLCLIQHVLDTHALWRRSEISKGPAQQEADGPEGAGKGSADGRSNIRIRREGNTYPTWRKSSQILCDAEDVQ